MMSLHGILDCWLIASLDKSNIDLRRSINKLPRSRREQRQMRRPAIFQMEMIVWYRQMRVKKARQCHVASTCPSLPAHELETPVDMGDEMVRVVHDRKGWAFSMPSMWLVRAMLAWAPREEQRAPTVKAGLLISCCVMQRDLDGRPSQESLTLAI
ncbi:hypothetical protein K402DRAFT_180082 [Aulographum hederae CBS 113979]|uniref:Uncharacterized protein n=1 Tax=Aulographum hederae CBS 113979 TaxID=1176131 RepID=A0A6G1GQY3_9PEZI|nr:hypothetical protein K402DRAFT_180082 [Aulographum hederae CBS 113979]